LTGATYRSEGPLRRLFAGRHKTYNQLVEFVEIVKSEGDDPVLQAMNQFFPGLNLLRLDDS
jgi:hypothetical protein